jgi:hypothetical protein
LLIEEHILSKGLTGAMLLTRALHVVGNQMLFQKNCLIRGGSKEPS